MERRGSQIDGDWELRDGKWYRRDTILADKPKVSGQTTMSCPNCPGHLKKIELITSERDKMTATLNEREKTIVSLRSQIDKLQFELKNWTAEKAAMMKRMKEMEMMIAKLKKLIEERKGWVPLDKIKEKDIMIQKLITKIKELQSLGDGKTILMKEKQTLIIRLKKLEEELAAKDKEIERLKQLLSELEQQIVILKQRPGEKIVVKEVTERVVERAAEPAPQTWYYAVQDPAHAQMFQASQRYFGGDIIVDSLEGATVVNPDYFTQSEHVPGQARLRVRAVDAVGIGLPQNTELFIRLRLGTATQFSHPRPVDAAAAQWHQDFVFVGVPLKPSVVQPDCAVSQYPLVVEVVSRTIGSASEQVVGSLEVNLEDLIVSLTRVSVLNLQCGGQLTLRLKAMDFGLQPNAPSGGVRVVSVDTHTETMAMPDRGGYDVMTNSRKVAQQLDMLDGSMDGRVGDAKITVDRGLGVASVGNMVGVH